MLRGFGDPLWSPSSIFGKPLPWFSVGFSIGQIKMDLGKERPEVSGSAVWLSCVPGPLRGGSVVFSLGCGGLEMLWREGGVGRGCLGRPPPSLPAGPLCGAKMLQV